MKSSCVLLLAPLILWCLPLAGVAQATEPEIERIFGPEVKTGPYKHPACMTELGNGDLYLVYYGGEGEYARDTGVFGSRQRAGGRRVGQPRRIAHDPLRSVGNAVVWQAPDGLVWLFYVVRFGDTWSTSRVQAKISYDEARNLVRLLDARARRGNAGPQPAARAQERRLPAASLPRDWSRHRDDRARQLFLFPPLRRQGQNLDQDSADPLSRGETSSRPWFN